MSATCPFNWYVRKSGWVQGPYTGDQIRSMYALTWLGPSDRVSEHQKGPWRPLRSCLTLIASSEPPAADGVPRARWEIASGSIGVDQPVEIGMLQILAAAGRLRLDDRVREVPGGTWIPARLVEGVFGGRRAWCSACGQRLADNRRNCHACGAVQPDYEPSLATVAFVCGILGFAWYAIAFVAVTMLAINRSTVYGVAIDARFPQVHAICLMPALWLAAVAVVVGRMASIAIQSGRSAPADAGQARIGTWLGWATVALLTLTGVGIAAYSAGSFRPGY